MDRLPLDAEGRVVGFDPDFPAARRERFEDLGLLPETPVRLLHAAPWGGPIAVSVRGTVLCLRREDARRIRVSLP